MSLLQTIPQWNARGRHLGDEEVFAVPAEDEEDTSAPTAHKNPTSVPAENTNNASVNDKEGASAPGEEAVGWQFDRKIRWL